MCTVTVLTHCTAGGYSIGTAMLAPQYCDWQLLHSPNNPCVADVQLLQAVCLKYKYYQLCVRSTNFTSSVSEVWILSAVCKKCRYCHLNVRSENTTSFVSNVQRLPTAFQKTILTAIYVLLIQMPPTVCQKYKYCSPSCVSEVLTVPGACQECMYVHTILYNIVYQ
jgi:hypothetical protein